MKKLFTFLTICLLTANVILATDFTKGNLVVLSVGQSGETLSDAGNTVFLNEYDTNGNLVQSIQMPNAGRSKLILSGADYYCGYLNRSTDQKYLTLAGFNATIGQVTDLDASEPSSIARMVAVVDASGSYDVTTKLADVTRTPRGVCSTDGDNLWISAPTWESKTQNYGGILYTKKGNTKRVDDISRRDIGWSNTKILNNNGYNLLFAINSYADNMVNETVRLYMFATDDDYTSNCKTGNYTEIPKEFSSEGDYGYAQSLFNKIPNSITDFVFIDQSASVSGLDVAYFCCSETASGSLTKVVGAGSMSSINEAQYTICDNSYYYFGIIEGSVSESSVVLYATRLNNSTGNYELVKITDNSGQSGDPTENISIEVLATATSGTAFRGIALAPQTETDKKTQAVDGLEYSIEKKYNDDNFKLEATAVSTGNEVVYTIADNSVATIDDTDSVHIVGAGETTINVAVAGNDTYYDFEATLTLIIEKAYQLVLSEAISENTISKTTADEDFSILTTLKSGRTTYYISGDDAIASVDYSTGIVHIEDEGTCDLYVIEDGDDNWECYTKNYTLTVASSSVQTISNFDDIEKTVDDADFTLSATASGGGDITYSCDNSSVATISGSTVHIVGKGTANITAKQAGDADHDPVEETVTLSVKYTQTIQNFDSDITINVDNTSYYLQATTTSGLSVTYDVEYNAVVSVDASTGYVDVHKIGETKIIASQPGDDDYAAAEDKSITFKVVEAGAGVEDVTAEKGFVAIKTSDETIAVLCYGNYSNVNWQLYALSGNVVANGTIASVTLGDIITLNASVKSGIYLLRLTTGNNDSFCLKMVH